MGLSSITGLLRIGEADILANGARTVGRVTMANPCWWLKVNKKTVRLYSTDGATFPNIITFEYKVDGKTYTGKHFVNWNVSCPAEGSSIVVYYDRDNPKKYAVRELTAAKL